MFRGSLIALLVAALAAGFLGGRLTTSGQGTELEALRETVAQLSQKLGELEAGMIAPEELQGKLDELAATMEAEEERKLEIGYVDMARVNQSLWQLGFTEIEYFEPRIQKIIQQIGEQEDYDLVIQRENNVILYPQAESITDLTDRVIEALKGR